MGCHHLAECPVCDAPDDPWESLREDIDAAMKRMRRVCPIPRDGRECARCGPCIRAWETEMGTLADYMRIALLPVPQWDTDGYPLGRRARDTFRMNLDYADLPF